MKRQEIYKEVEEIDNKIMKPSIILMIRAHICSEFSNKTILFFVVQSTELSIQKNLQYEVDKINWGIVIKYISIQTLKNYLSLIKLLITYGKGRRSVERQGSEPPRLLITYGKGRRSVERQGSEPPRLLITYGKGRRSVERQGSEPPRFILSSGGSDESNYSD